MSTQEDSSDDEVSGVQLDEKIEIKGSVRRTNIIPDELTMSALDNRNGVGGVEKQPTDSQKDLQTQKVDPLTESQLDAIMNENVISSDPPYKKSLAILDDERISSSDESDNDHSLDPDTTPTFLNFSQHAADLHVIDETPLKPIMFPTPDSVFIFLLCRWQEDTAWWPCRANKLDWDVGNTNSVVLFRDDEEGTCDLSKAKLFDLRIGDVVHFVGSRPSKRRYEVIQLSRPSETDSIMSTSDRSSQATLRYNDQPVIDVAVADIYLTANDMRIWNQQRETSRNTRRNANIGNSDNRRISSDNDMNSDDPEDRERRDGEYKEDDGDVDESVPMSGLRNARKTLPANQSSPTRASNAKRGRNTPDQGSPARSGRGSARGSARGSPRRVLRHVEIPTSPSSAIMYRNGGETKKRKLADIFKHCCFSISASRESESIMYLIESLGGTVLQNGLNDLISLSKSEDQSIELSADFGQHKFIAVLSDSPRRTPKYLEMVALGWPCLAINYINDCIESNRILDWVSYILPAGKLLLENRRQDVSAECSYFHRLWLLNSSLQTQFLQRRITLQCFCPIFVLRKKKNRAVPYYEDNIQDASDSQLILLTVLSAPPNSVKIVETLRNVPNGSLVIDLGCNSDTVSTGLDNVQKYHLRRYASLNKTIKTSTSWLAQCIINGEII